MSLSDYISVLKQYQEFLDLKAMESVETGSTSGTLNSTSHLRSLSVGIVGGGMAGLYSALLLQKYLPHVKVKIFEASERVGGRVYTHKFSPEPYQYFETGAARIPCMESHEPVFRLIQHLNQEFPNDPISLIECVRSCPEGNRVFLNHTRQRDGRVMSTEYARKHFCELGFPSKGGFGDYNEMNKLLKEALVPVVDALKTNFEAAIEKYGHMSMHDYLSIEMGWSSQKINVAGNMTNEFQTGVINLFLFGAFCVEDCKTIDGGMSRLPELCAKAIKRKNGDTLLKAKVKSIITRPGDNSSVEIGYADLNQPRSKELIYKTFDAIILTIPPPFIRMIPKRPHWGPDLEQALRASPFNPLSKMGLRFNTRFWERSDLEHPPSQGGMSMTDLPSRWVIYPEHGIGDSGKGVLHTYNRFVDDAKMWNFSTKAERISLVLGDLQQLYPEVNIAQEYAGGEDKDSEKFLEEAFAMDWSLGYVLNKPASVFSILMKPQGNVYFAGSHLSSSVVWITSALESAKRAVQQLVLAECGEKNVAYL